MTEVQRCPWPGHDPLYVAYHDEEWGVPVHDDRHLFEMLILEGAQAGLSWITVLRKRDAYRAAFDGFDAAKIARYSDARVLKLMLNPGIVRNRLKIAGTVKNARAFLAVQKEFGTFDSYLWRFVNGAPKVNRPHQLNASKRRRGHDPAKVDAPRRDGLWSGDPGRPRAMRRKARQTVTTNVSVLEQPCATPANSPRGPVWTASLG